MSDGLTDQERKDKFTQYLRKRVFGLVAFLEKPNAHTHFPMASGIVVEIEGYGVLLTAGHFLKDVERWHVEGRLNGLCAIVTHELAFWRVIELKLDENELIYNKEIDIGFLLLSPGVIEEIIKYGGQPIKEEALQAPEAEVDRFFLVGLASVYCKIVQETIATQRQGDEIVEWKISRPGALSLAVSRIELEGEGHDPETLLFALVNGVKDYSGMSGGPVFGYSAGARIPEYSLIGIQSEQVLSATSERKPTHVIATSADVAVAAIRHYLRKLDESAPSPSSAM